MTGRKMNTGGRVDLTVASHDQKQYSGNFVARTILAEEPSLVSEGVLAFLRCRNIDIYGVHKNVKCLRHL